MWNDQWTRHIWEETLVSWEDRLLMSHGRWEHRMLWNWIARIIRQKELES